MITGVECDAIRIRHCVSPMSRLDAVSKADIAFQTHWLCAGAAVLLVIEAESVQSQEPEFVIENGENGRERIHCSHSVKSERTILLSA